MSQFTRHLGINLLEDSRGWAVTRHGRCQWYLSDPPLAYDVGYLGSGETIVVPSFDPTPYTDAQLKTLWKVVAGFTVSDLTSSPWWGRWLIANDGPWTKAAIVHDFLYATRGMGGRYSRKRCDEIFLEAMLVTGVTPWKAWVIYIAVRAGGWRSW